MKLYRLSFFSMLPLLALSSACTDDSTNTQPGDEKPADYCDDAKLCPDGMKCLENHCRHEAMLGDSCVDENVVCIEGECIDGVCTTKKKGECEKDKDCSNHYVCVDNKCYECRVDNDCGDNKECKNHQCHAIVTPEPTDPVECTDDSSCEAGKTKCANDGYCHEMAEIDGACSDSIPCQDGQFCKSNQCTNLLEIGEECLDDSECAGEAECLGYCTLTNQKGGQACNDFITCSGEFECLDGVCRQVVVENAACDDVYICPKDTVCMMDKDSKKCIHTYGECDTDDKCSKDSYCCMEEACTVKNVCIPYDFGPRQNQNTSCSYKTVKGLFEAAIQCEWKAPEPGEPYPNHYQVLSSPVVANTPHDSGLANEVIFISYNYTDGGAWAGRGDSASYYGVIRIVNAENCKLHESIFDDNNRIIGGSNLAVADVDSDGFVEIFAGRGTYQKSGAGGGLVAFHWNKDLEKYETWWKTTDGTSSADQTIAWAGPAIHDINNDGIPEIIGYGGEVFNTLNGMRLNSGQLIDELSRFPALGDLDNDGNVEIIGVTNVYRWNTETSKWEIAYPNINKALGYGGAYHGYHFAFADFGSPKKSELGEDLAEFEYGKFDGKAEIVSCGGNRVYIADLNGTVLFQDDSSYGGGPCTIGDFDGDQIPEVAGAFGHYYAIFDPQCTEDNPKCAGKGILWKKASQDLSSRSTGSSLFDFDGDGAMEAVYADECYTRVYDGKTGDVLFSAYRASETWHEYPVIADIDNDESAEIIVGSNDVMSCQSPDPIHRGLRCEVDSDCKSNVCKSKLCRCTTNDQCNWRTDDKGNLINDEYGCVAPLSDADNPSEGNVCRAIRNNAKAVTGIRIMKDRLDRWMSSRNIWNQHAYSITNINDDQTIPMTEKWVQNFLDLSLNNYRQNKQGKTGANRAPDITGRFVGDTCGQNGDHVVLGAEICNRGTKMVASLMPASFYQIGIDENGNETRTHLCTSYTSENVPVGGCLHVECNIPEVVLGDIVLVANDDGKNGKTTVECNEKNNEDRTSVTECPILIN